MGLKLLISSLKSLELEDFKDSSLINLHEDYKYFNGICIYKKNILDLQKGNDMLDTFGLCNTTFCTMCTMQRI